MVLVVKFLEPFVCLSVMFSLPVPSAITLAFTPGYLQRSGPRGCFRAVTGPYRLRLLETAAGRRLFLDLDPSIFSEARPSLSAQAARLSRLASQREGLVRGYRRRLRLVGVGFRATQINTSSAQNASIAFKLGYSHDVEKSLTEFNSQGIFVAPSRLEGRTKGTLVSLEGTDLSRLNQCAAAIRALRYPDPYKGKGIQYDREIITLKKGKREGLLWVFFVFSLLNGLTLFSTLRYCSSC